MHRVSIHAPPGAAAKQSTSGAFSWARPHPDTGERGDAAESIGSGGRDEGGRGSMCSGPGGGLGGWQAPTAGPERRAAARTTAGTPTPRGSCPTPSTTKGPPHHRFDQGIRHREQLGLALSQSPHVGRLTQHHHRQGIP